MIATLTPDRTAVTLRGAMWGETFAVDQLPSRIALYRNLAKRKGGAYEAIYQPTVAQLEAVSKLLGNGHG